MGDEKKGSGNGSEPKTYVITGAQAIQSDQHERFYGKDKTRGAPNMPLIRNIDRYTGLNTGETMILQMQGMGPGEVHLHPFFEKRSDIYINPIKLARLEAEILRETEKANKKGWEWDGRDSGYFKTIKIKALNSKIDVADLIVPPQNKDPSTGRLDIPQNQLGKTIIFAHPKQRWKSAPKSIGRKYPRLLMTTGACTHPNYPLNGKGDIANWDHKYGFVVVDVVDSKRYFPRIVPSLKNGTFVDMGKVYRPGQKPKRIGVEALVLGDIHYGEHDEDTMQANREMMEFFRPKNVFLHDGVDCHSMNPHERADSIKRAIAFREGRLDIVNEFEEAYECFVREMAREFPKTNFWFVYSNHSPDFARRYLTQFQFVEEPWNDNAFVNNLRIGLLEGSGPVKTGLNMVAGEYSETLPKNINFLELKEGKRILGYELGAHGHRGANGARGSPIGMKRGHSKGISGHTHSPDINGDWYIVGTSSKIPLAYAEGQPGSQMPANAVLYSNGLVQLLPIIVGKWKK